MKVSRRRIGLITSVSPNGTEVRTSEEMQMLDQHLQFLKWYKSWKTHTIEVKVEVEVTSAKPKGVFWNQTLHHYAVVFGEKIQIHSEEEYKRYLSLGFKILPK